MELLVITFYVLSTAIVATYAYVKYKYSYWNRLGIPCIEPQIPYGNFGEAGKCLHTSQIMAKYYEQLKGQCRFGGVYAFLSPIALITDLDLMKDILIRDFNYFTDRGGFYNERDDPLSAHLLTLDGQRWKAMRAKLTPTFTSGKLKVMFPTMIEIGERFQRVTRAEISGPDIEIEMRELLARFTTDIIGTVAFGIECNSLKDSNTQFRRFSRKAFENPINTPLRRQLLASYPEFARKLRFRITHKDVSEFFLKVVRDTIEYRKTHKVQRNDFMNLLMNLQEHETDGLTTEEIAAQAFLFFLAGFETSSTTMSYALHELSLNPEVQTKARDEINKVLTKYNGVFTYEAMMEMHYVDQIISGTYKLPVSVCPLQISSNFRKFIILVLEYMFEQMNGS